MSKQKVTINGKQCAFKKGETILEIALKNNIKIPHLCFHKDLEIQASCRTCLVEILDENKHPIRTSCTLKAEPGMEVSTKTEEVKKLRQTNLELALAEHEKNCPKCQNDQNCKAAQIIKNYGLNTKKYQHKQLDKDVIKLSTAIEIDPNLCINCGKCKRVCESQGICFLETQGKGADAHITTKKEQPHLDCIYCGQCSLKCPTNAIREQTQIPEVEKELNNPDKTVIVQMAPSVRTSIGEEFGLEAGADLTGQMFTAFRKLGFDKVFDVNMAADITTMVEAHELIERLEHNENLPMFTSCCPAWVKFIEFYYPEMLNHLTTSRSPQIHAGGAYKTWWAEKAGIDPEDIVVVSIMPCTAKKQEARLEKLKVNNLYPVDYVLTTRETASLLKKYQINPVELEPSTVDKYGVYSGAAAIYGASGGVMESALRTTAHLISGRKLDRFEYQQVRGEKGIKKTSVTVNGNELNLAVVSTPKNARIILKELKEEPDKYHYVEFMACPGGCIGGGGQSKTTSKETIKKRITSLYKIDQTSKIRKAHENEIVKDFFNYLENQPEELKQSLLYTTYKKKNKEN